jgi:hypothetical protein
MGMTEEKLYFHDEGFLYFKVKQEGGMTHLVTPS